MARARRRGAATSSGSLPGSDPDAGTLLLGSHLDTVRDAGAFDGPLGVLAAIACVARLRARGRDAAVRRSTCSGSPTRRGCASGPRTSAAARSRGRSTRRCSTCADADGVTRARGARRRRAAAARRGAASGCSATSSCTSSRGRCSRSATRRSAVVDGDRGRDARRGARSPAAPGHAGHGADGAAARRRAARLAEFVLAVEAAGRAEPGLVATVGQLRRAAGRAERRSRARRSASLDVRHADDAVRGARGRRRCASARGRRSRRRAGVERRRGTSGSTTPAVAMDAGADATRLARRGRGAGLPDVRLPSGAGHDAVALARADAGRRCCSSAARAASATTRTSRSTSADVAVALDVLDRFLRGLAGVSADLVIRGADVAGDRAGGHRDRGRPDRRDRAGAAGRRARRSTRAGLLALPGVVDAHVHLNDPGRADWEGFATGTAALAAGGTTCAIDMPLNAIPPTVDGAAFDAKVARGGRASLRVDVALWGGLVPGDRRPARRAGRARRRRLQGVHVGERRGGVPGRPTTSRCWRGCARAARLGLPVAVHAESDELTARARARGPSRRAGPSMRDYLASRPVVAELEAIGRAIAFAAETGCALHVVHVSQRPRRRARRRGAGARRRRDAARPARTTSCSTPRTRSGSARSRSARRRCARRRSARRCGRAGRRRPRRHRPLAVARGAEAGRRHVRGVGRDRGRADAARAGVRRGRVAPARLASTARRRRRRAALRARARQGRAGRRRRRRRGAASTRRDRGRWRAEDLLDRHRLSPFVGRRLRGRVVRTVLRGVDGGAGRARGRGAAWAAWCCELRWRSERRVECAAALPNFNGALRRGSKCRGAHAGRVNRAIRR